VQRFQVEPATSREVIRRLVQVDPMHGHARNFISMLGDPSGELVNLFADVVQRSAAVVDADIANRGYIRRDCQLRHLALVILTIGQ
jgi:hypothetical protein